MEQDSYKNKSLGHQAPKGWRHNVCTAIELNGDFAYCDSHDFVYNPEEEERKLYDGEACYYTDSRFGEQFNNFYKRCYLRMRRHNPFSIKSAIRKIKLCKGIPVGTIVELTKSWYHSEVKISNSFLFKVKKENPIDFSFEINDPSYFRNFVDCEKSQKLTDLLRSKGFIVSVREGNPNKISSMIAVASSLIGGDLCDIDEEEGQIAIAYGHGMKIGFSSGKDSIFGYQNACDNILFDFFDEFNKWSQCREISKDKTVDEIVEELLESKSFC